jgi:hypothetical protein
MKQTTYLLTALAFAAGASVLSADPVESFLDEQFGSLEESVPGKFSINNRLRYEEFQTSTDDDQGLTNRVRYGYTTPNFSGFTAMAEGETVSALNSPDQQHFLDDAGDGTDLNQLWVQYADADYGKVKVGRQIYSLDDHRFIGHVGWRQNIQTFDAATAVYTHVENLTVNAFYIDAANRINDDYVAMDAFGVNVDYKFSSGFKLTGFFYSIDESDIVELNNETAGLRATGAFTFSEADFNYAVSLAEQDNDIADAGYFAGDLSTAISGVTLGVGFEYLEADFRTPLATVHKFNGFADKFAVRSVGLGGGLPLGLEDRYAYVGYKIPVGNEKVIPLKVVFHDFSPETGGGEGGTEIDLVASYKINKYLSLVSKYGDYSADSDAVGYFAGDKKMFTFELNFVY